MPVKPFENPFKVEGLERLSKLPPDEKKEKLKELWTDVALALAVRAKNFSQFCTDRDFGKLFQLIKSGEVALEKAFPPKEHAHNAPAFVVNMFGSLGQRATAIAQPTVPTIDVKAKEVEWQDSAGKTMSSSQTKPETSNTTKPSEA